MKELIKKIDMFKLLFKESNILTCPVCQNKLFILNNSLKCKDNHNFDINKKGYVSLLKKQRKFSSKIYTKELFESRRKTILSNLYNQMHIAIANFINKTELKNINIFEVGCGESTHSYLIKSKLKIINNYVVSDLSKIAIELSTNYLKDGLLPIICDANNTPIMYNSIDYIIDILSPFNYKEVYKTLKNNGYMIKVFPEKEYLKELRALVDIEEYKKEEEVYNNFCKYFKVVKTEILKYTIKLENSLAKEIFKMTPMTNNHKINENLKTVTINLKIVFAQKKPNI